MDHRSERLIVGRPELWAEFQSQHQEFLKHVPTVVSVSERALATPASFTEPVDRVIHGLTSICLEEFTELLVVCGNGLGIAGLKLLRTMFENAVTARYLQLEPGEVNHFLDYLFVAEKKMLDAMTREAGPDAVDGALREQTEREFARVKGSFEVELCPRCHRHGMNYRWSTLDFVSMAMKCRGLDRFILPAYRDPLQYTHAGVGGLFARLEHENGGVFYRTAPQWEEAEAALLTGHAVLLRSIGFYVEHYHVADLDEAFADCVSSYETIWRPRLNKT